MGGRLWVVSPGVKGALLHTPRLVTLRSEEEVPTRELWGLRFGHTQCALWVENLQDSVSRLA